MQTEFTSKEDWLKRFKDYVGFERPSISLPKNFIQVSKYGKLLKKFPIPWQSVPVLSPNGTVFNVIEENEQLTFLEERCPYCGLAFNSLDAVSRWTKESENPTLNGSNIISDNLPLHKKCMKKARVFCPFMRTVDESEFEYGDYKNIKPNADNFLFKNGIKR
jgi:hypothetical protein